MPDQLDGDVGHHSIMGIKSFNFDLVTLKTQYLKSLQVSIDC